MVMVLVRCLAYAPGREPVLQFKVPELVDTAGLLATGAAAANVPSIGPAHAPLASGPGQAAQSGKTSVRRVPARQRVGRHHRELPLSRAHLT
jgi:hypothetical protein